MINYSLLRDCEYQELAKLTLNGQVLDLGGSKISKYHSLFKGEHKILVGNIDENYGMDFYLDVEKKFEITNNSFEAVLAINLLEHVYNYQNVLWESYRILKNNGLLIVVVPYLLNIHNCPSDYFRYTRAGLQNILREAGFKNIEIKELGTGVFSVIYQLSIGFLKFLGPLTQLFKWLFVFLDKLLSLIKKDSFLSNKYMPLGYIVKAYKIE